MNKTKIGRFGVLFLILIFIVGLTPVGATSGSSKWVNVPITIPDGAKIITTQNAFSMQQLWHYSAGFWGIHTSNPLRIYDSQIKGDVEKLAEKIDTTASFAYSLPENVKAALAVGKKVGVCVSHDSNKDYFNSSRGLPQAKFEDGELSFEAYPKFHLLNVDMYGTYDYFVTGLNNTIPFVDPQYGTNAYAMYTKDNKELGVGYGYFNPDNPTQLGPAGTIHPSQIADNNGYLQPGFSVTIAGKTYDSGDIKIGVGTFKNAGAVGLTFYYNLTITYYEISDNDVAVTAITPTVFPASQPVGAQVIVSNPGSEKITAPVQFTNPGITEQQQSVTLLPGEDKTLIFTFTSPESGTFPMTAIINPDRAFDESDFTNNELTVTGQVLSGNDVAVSKIEKTSYPATSVVTADVTVKNLGAASTTTPVEFHIPGITTQSKDVTLAVGQTQTLHFTFSTPPSGTLNMTAEANKTRAISERDYTNNKLTVNASIVSAPTGSASCSDTIRWTENDDHWVPAPFGGYPCYHTFTYETKLTATHSLTPKTLKSGYGFAVTVNNAISTSMVKNTGCGSWGNSRAHSLSPTPPDKAQVKLGWTVKNRLGTQPATLDLKLLSRTAAQSRFEPAQNPISEIRAKQIYTDVALAGTQQSPKTHQIRISITGGGVNGISFCKEITDRITINGYLYEDDFTGAN